jgi:hypothetical protein
MHVYIFQILEGLQGTELRCSEAHDGKITCILFSLDGDKIAIGLLSGLIKV